MRATSFLTIEQLKTWCKVTPGQSKTVTQLLASGGVATATVANHGFRHGDTVRIAGANDSAYNGSFVISVVDANKFSYTITGSPASPATGTLTAQSDQDALITLVGDRVCADLERETGRTFKKRATVTDVLDGTGTRAIVLSRVPVLAVASVTVADTLIDATLYAVERRVGLLRMKSGVFPRALGNVSVVYSAGFEDADLPADAIGVALDVARYIYDRASTGAIAASSLSIGGSNINIVPGLPRDLRNSIERLRSGRMVG